MGARAIVASTLWTVGSANVVDTPMLRRLAWMLFVPLLISSCHTDPPTPDLVVYAVNRDSGTATVRADGAARTVGPCELYRQGFFGTGNHELQVETPSGNQSKTVHSVRGSYATGWYVIGASGEIVDSTQSEVNAVLAVCKVTGAGASPT
jgi:hypothetical protein